MLGRTLNGLQGAFADTGLGNFLGAVNPNITPISAGDISWNSARPSSFSNFSSSATSNVSSPFSNLISSEAAGSPVAGATGAAGQAASGSGSIFDRIMDRVSNVDVGDIGKILDVAGSIAGPTPPAGSVSQEQILAEKQAKAAADAENSRRIMAALNAAPGVFTQNQMAPTDYDNYAFRTGNQRQVDYGVAPENVPQVAKGGTPYPAKPVTEEDIKALIDAISRQTAVEAGDRALIGTQQDPQEQEIDGFLKALESSNRAEAGDRALIGGGYPKKAKGGKVPAFLMSPTVMAGKGGRYYEGEGGGQDDTLDVGNALLSPGEYVVQADVVADLGDGNPKEGAKKLDFMGEAVRKHKAKGKKSPKSADPLKYLSKRRNGKKLRDVRI
jgi:hypothetical protein